jgi:glyoxylase-like metal-dependent hydrolase (beta-lactamase superfamily II)
MRRELTLGVVIGVGLLSIGVAAYQAPAQAPAAPRVIDLVKLKDNLYVLASAIPGDPKTFSGGNVAVFITDTGVTLVDSKLAGWGQAILDKIKTVTSKPVTMIINTHTHGDHTGNDDFFGPNVEIVAHENTKANMEKMDAFKGQKSIYVPRKTFKDKMTIGSGKDQIDLFYFGPGHTNGDAWIVFPALRVLHAGDMVAWKDAPVCDRNNGGSCVAFPKTLANVVDNIKNVDTVIPGHMGMITMKDVQEYQRYMTDLVAGAQAAIKAGKTVDEAVAGLNLASKYPTYKSERVKAAVQAIYDELKQ